MNRLAVLLVALLLGLSSWVSAAPDPVRSPEAALALVYRLYPESAHHFHFHLIPITPANLDQFTITSNSSGVYIGGTSANVMTAGFNYYMTYYMNITVLTWSSTSVGLLKLPLRTTIYTETYNYDYTWRYYYNICTLSYTMAWWDWPTWEREIDWMALRGVNMPLALTGQELIWYDTYTSVGLNHTEITAFLSGPAFMAWQRMGNIQGWAGPMTMNWMRQQRDLQRLILRRMRALDMRPILPAFNGYVPMALSAHYPHADIHRSAGWAPFPDQYNKDSLLNPTDPLFARIGQAFLRRLIEEFGTDHLYNSDTYNEMTPSSNSTDYLRNQSLNIYSAMSTVDSSAIWVMQGWVFVSDPGFWKPAQIQAWLDVIANDRLIMLDLMSELAPVYSRTNNFYGKGFIWNQLHNFGGNNGMYGLIDQISTAPATAKQQAKQSMVGIGTTPEGINQNELMYELLYDMARRGIEPIDNLEEWLNHYVVSRYGLPVNATGQPESPWIPMVTAYNILASTVYNCTTGQWGVTKSYLELTPTLYMNSSGFMATNIWYDNRQLEMACRLLLSVARFMPQLGLTSVRRWEYDLIDTTKQFLSNRLIDFQTQLTTAYQGGDYPMANGTSAVILELIMDFDRLLGTNENFLLGRWIEMARSWGSTIEEEDWLEFNARNQITLWGPTGQIADYASKQWSGLISGYYLPRWELYTDTILTAMANRIKWNETSYDERKREREERWQVSLEKYSEFPEGRTVEMVEYVLQKYSQTQQEVRKGVEMKETERKRKSERFQHT